jgi:hypothetical protein
MYEGIVTSAVMDGKRWTGERENEESKEEKETRVVT